MTWYFKTGIGNKIKNVQLEPHNEYIPIEIKETRENPNGNLPENLYEQYKVIGEKLVFSPDSLLDENISENEALAILLGGVPQSYNQSAVEIKSSTLILAQIIVQRQSGLLTDNEALTSPEVFEKWAPDMPYGEGQIIRGYTTEQLFRVIIPGGVSKSIVSEYPESSDVLSVYRPIVKSHAGTFQDPITWAYGMDCVSGKYYSYNLKVYLCKGDMIPCTWAPETFGMWQWEIID